MKNTLLSHREVLSERLAQINAALTADRTALSDAKAAQVAYRAALKEFAANRAPRPQAPSADTSELEAMIAARVDAAAEVQAELVKLDEEIAAAKQAELREQFFAAAAELKAAMAPALAKVHALASRGACFGLDTFAIEERAGFVCQIQPNKRLVINVGVES